MKNFLICLALLPFFILPHSLLYLLIRHERFIHIQNVLIHSVTNLVFVLYHQSERRKAKSL